MAQCNLAYIPPRLHWNDRATINEFFQDELLFRRCKDKSSDDPFTVSLYEISINRKGPLDGQLGEENDVLFNIDDNDYILYEGMEVFIMNVEKIDPNYKTYVYNDETLPYKMILLHDPLDCNYFHAIFRISYKDNDNEIIVNEKNYKTTLGNSQSAMKKLRGRIRYQLTNMRYRKEIILNS